MNFENDNVFPTLYDEPSDRFYTQSLRVSFGRRAFDQNDALDELPAWSRIAARRCPACRIFPKFSFGQEVHTPELIESPDPQPGEHPWAAWLYGELSATVDTPKGGRHEYRIQVGVTGDASQGRELQEFWHRIINRPQPQGWDNQFGEDFGINAYYNYQQIWLTSKEGSRITWDFLPNVEAAFGTMRTHAAFGGTVRIGPDVGGFMYPHVERRVERLAWPVNWREVDIYGFVGANLHLVGHNYFLEGSRFHDDPGAVEREDIVQEFILGATANYKGWAMTFSVTYRTEEFERFAGEDSGKHAYGSLTVSRGIR